MLTPPIRASDLAELHKLPFDEFKNLCRDLLDMQEDIAHCSVYGKSGQSQRGII